jgi:hypothetical protein
LKEEPRKGRAVELVRVLPFPSADHREDPPGGRLDGDQGTFHLALLDLLDAQVLGLLSEALEVRDGQHQGHRVQGGVDPLDVQAPGVVSPAGLADAEVRDVVAQGERVYQGDEIVSRS